MFFTNSKLENINKLLSELGAQDIHVSAITNNWVTLKFDFLIDRKKVSLSLDFQNRANWTTPPIFTLLTRPMPALDHVGHSGQICTTDHQGENFQGYKHGALISLFLRKTINILEQSFNNLNLNNRSSLYNELEGYLGNIQNIGDNLILHCNPLTVTQLYGWLKKSPKGNHQVLEQIDDGNNTYTNHSQLTKVKVHKVLLDDAYIFPIPNIGDHFTEYDFLKIINSLSDEKKQSLLKQGNHYVLLGIPNGHGFAYLVISYAIWYSFKEKVSFNSFEASLTQRAWVDYLLNRTGQEQKSRHIVIIGCGALGSKIAEILAQTGINQFSLIDPEFLKTDNIYRHALGLQYINTYKSISLAKKLLAERPGLIISPFIDYGERWIKSKIPENVDTIILAIGHTPTEISIIKTIYELNRTIQIVTGWLEPYDLGGHFISFNNKNLGCLNCLYFDENSNKSLTPKYKFTKSDQLIAKNITGCAGAFTPFSSLNCTKLASYISDYVVNQQLGFVSLSGNQQNASKNGVITTPYYDVVHSSNGINSLHINEIYEEVCPCCNT
jgi:hypothetical protein